MVQYYLKSMNRIKNIKKEVKGYIMEYKDIKKLMDDMGESKLDSLEIEFPDGIKISMTKGGVEYYTNAIPASAPMTTPAVIKETPTSLVVTKDNTNNEIKEEYKEIKSPMVGTFYASSSPDKEAFVKVGDKVKKGQVVCIVEAMKLMNEIESEFDGEIVEICVNNQEMVEYGKTLFKVK